jgi:dipeptidyl aminopeptidase/acylaminoacyl peptidase
MYQKAVATCSLFFLLSLSVVCHPAFAGIAQGPLKIEDALGALALANRMPIAMSPDGELVAYTLKDDRKLESTQDERYSSYTRTGAFTEGLGCDVWMTNTRSGQSRNLTEGKGTSSSPVWSPDGKYLAFYSDRSGTFHVWLWERASGKIRQLSDAIARPFFNFQVVRWTPDSRFVLAKVLPEGMTVEQAADLLSPPSQAASKAGKPTGVTVTVFSSPAADEKSPSRAPSEKPVADESWMNRYAGDLALIEVTTGTVRHVATGIKPLGYWVSPDGTHLAYLNWKGIEENTQQPVYELRVLSLADHQSRVLVPKLKQDYGISVSWAPDSGSLAYTTSDNGDCYVVSRNGGEPRNLTTGTHPPFSDDHRAPLWDASGQLVILLSSEQYGRVGSAKIWAASPAQATFRQIADIPDRVVLEVLASVGDGHFWSPDGRSMIVMTRHERTKDVGFYRVDVSSGAATLLFEEPRYSSGDRIFHADVSRDGKTLAYVAQDAQHPEDIWVSGPTLVDRRRLTRINPQIESLTFGKSRIIEWRGVDGQPLRGALLLPANFEEGKRYPLIVDVYGGSYRSAGAYRFGLSGSGVENLQILATRGYAVLLPDTPLRKGTPMQDLLKTVMPGVDRAIDLGIADPDRLGVMGHSYGGYSTLSLIVQTTRFKAAVDSAGPANLISFYGVMHKSGAAGGIGWSETGQGGMVGTPWQVRDRYIENSPLFYLDRVETPLLIVQGDLDLITLQSDEVFVALRRLGKEVVYAKYAGEDHWEGTWSAANVVDYWNRVIGWFDAHLSTAGAKKQE